MEKRRSLYEKIEKMKGLGIFEKWKANADARTANMYRRYNFSKEYVRELQKNRRTVYLNAYVYLSDVLEASFIFAYSPEGYEYWDRIVDQLRGEI